MAKRDQTHPHLLATGETLPGPQAHYRVESVLESDGHTAVYEAHDPGAPWRRIALKEFAPALPDLFEREVRVSREATGHPLAPALYDAFPHEGYFYIARELIQGETLASLIPRHPSLPRRTILKWAVCLCDVLAFLHTRRIIHHGINPVHISINPYGYPILSGFGAAQLVGAAGDDPESGLPPEAASTDVAALGAVLYEMITGFPPDTERIRQSGEDVTHDLAARDDADPNLIALIGRAMAAAPPAPIADLLHDLRAFAPPVLLADVRGLDFGPVTEAAPQSVRLRNAGGGDLSVQVGASPHWLLVDPPARQDGGWAVVARPDPARIDERGQRLHGGLDIRGVRNGEAAAAGDRWLIDCSVQAPPAPARIPTGEPVSRGRGVPIVPPAAPKRPELPPAVPVGPSKGEIDIVPRSTVIGLITAIVVVALAVIYVVANHHPAASPGPTESVAGPGASAPPPTGQRTASAAASGGNLLLPTDDASAWKIEQNFGGAGSIAVEDHVLHVTVSRPGRKYWHVQFYQTPPGLRAHQNYTLTFRAKADAPCDLPVGGSINYGDFRPIGLTTHFALGRDWKTFSHAFITQSFTGSVRLPVFMVGTKPHQYWLSDVVLKKAAP